MDGHTPIDAYLEGRIREEELLAGVERVLTMGSDTDRTVLLHEWRTKSGRIRSLRTREKLNAKVAELTWVSGSDRLNLLTNPRDAIRVGTILANRFVIEDMIGSGGMGMVWKARDLLREEALDRRPFVAIKTFRRRDALQILQREARKAQELAHPNIVRVFDFDRDGDVFFVTMELLDGLSLDEVIRRNGSGGVALDDALPILKQIGAAIEFSHSERIVHSDLKPANVIIQPNGRAGELR